MEQVLLFIPRLIRSMIVLVVEFFTNGSGLTIAVFFAAIAIVLTIWISRKG